MKEKDIELLKAEADLRQYLADEDLLKYVDHVTINHTHLKDIIDCASTVTIMPGNNEGYYVDVSVLNESYASGWCSVRVSSDLDTALNVSNCLAKHYMK